MKRRYLLFLLLCASTSALGGPTPTPGISEDSFALNPTFGADNKQVEALLGSKELTAEAFAIAADTFAELMTRNKGDSGKAVKELQEAEKDPKGFEKKLSPGLQARIRSLAQKKAAADKANVGKK